MKLNTSLIANYDTLSLEEKVKALEELDFEPDYSGYIKKTLFDETASQLASYKKKYADTLSEEQRKALERQEQETELQRQIAELQEKVKAGERERAITNIKAKWIGRKADESLAERISVATVDNNIEELEKLMDEYATAQTKNIQRDMMGKDPTPPAGEPKSDKVDISKMSLDEINKMYQQNPHILD